MRKASLVVSAAACACGLSWPAAAQDAELLRLREEIRALRQSYDARLQALEQRLSEAESRAKQAQSAAPQPAAASAPAEAAPTPSAYAQAAPAAPAVSGLAAAASAFNPAISLILQGAYSRTSQDPERYQITGFVPSGGEVGPPRRSFGLGESELFLTASVDPYFRGALIASLAPDNALEVEEAFFQTTSLPHALTLKGGRFLSGIGYQNEIHQHAWDFQDAPLTYKAFLGGRYSQDGVQLKWLAPTPLFLELGAELGNGGAFPGNDRGKNGVGSVALLAHAGDDIGESYAWRAGVSYLRTGSRERTYTDLDSSGSTVTNAFSGRASVWILDAVLKWSPDGNSTVNNLKLQGEYFHATQSGDLTFDQAGAALTDGSRTSQSGWYAQGVYQFMPRWRVGYRYDALRRGSVAIGVVANGAGPTLADFPTLAVHDPTRHTAMLEFNPSEFSRLRLQYAADRSRLGATDHQLVLQYIHSLGPHGAHRF